MNIQRACQNFQNDAKAAEAAFRAKIKEEQAKNPVIIFLEKNHAQW